MRLKYVAREFDERLGAEITTLERLSVSQYRGVIPSSQNSARIQEPSSYEKYKVVQPGDLVLNRFNAYKGALGISSYDGVVSPDYMTVKLDTSRVDIRYIEYFLKSVETSAAIKMSMSGMGSSDPDSSAFSRLDKDDLFNLLLPITDLETQRRIADYLDKEISEMEALIEEFEGLISSLESRRRVFAVNLVRDDQYPLVPLSTIVSMNSGDSISSDVIKENGNYPVYGGNGLRGYTNTFNCETERVLIGRQGALCGNVHRVQPKFFATEHALVVKPKQNINLIWLEHALREMNLGELSTSVAQPGITATKVLFQRIHFPSPVEQEEIAQRLQKETAKTDALIEESTRLIENLKARKTALITEVVTGRKEV